MKEAEELLFGDDESVEGSQVSNGKGGIVNVASLLYAFRFPIGANFRVTFVRRVHTKIVLL